MQKIAQTISVVFHPIFVLTYTLMLLLLINPYLFSIQNARDRFFVVVSVFMLSVFFPLFAIFLMKMLGFVRSFELRERQERIVPLVVTGLFYLWLFINLYRTQIVPEAYTIIVLGATIALFTAFFINNFSKISLHAVGAGGLVGAVFLIKFFFSHQSFFMRLGSWASFEISVDFLVITCVLIAGLVCTARLYLNRHGRRDLFGGLAVGFLSQLLAFRILI